MSETNAELFRPLLPTSDAIGSDAECDGVRREEEYVYGRYLFVIAKARRRGKWLDAHEEVALDVVGCISASNGATFQAVINPRHASRFPEDESLPGVRRMVCHRSEIDDARRKIQEAGLQILGEYLR